MKTFKTNCGCEIHVIKWSSRANSVTMKSCPLHKAAPDLLAACKFFVNSLGSGLLVRDITHDAESTWALKMLEFVRDLSQAQAAITKAEGR